MTVLKDLANDLKGKSLLVTGGSGFFGKSICERLTELNQQYDLGIKIYALARNPLPLDGVEFISQDVRKEFNFNLQVDYIIHAATPVVQTGNSFDEMMDIIVNGTKNTFDFAVKAKCKKFLLISSGAVYGEQPDDVEQVSENQVFHGPFYDNKSAYTTGKRFSEMLAFDLSRKVGMHLNIARCFAFSGKHLPIDQHLAIGNFVNDAINRRTINIKGDGTAIRSYMDAEDLVDWLMTILIKAPQSEVYNVGSDQGLSIQDLATTIAKHANGVEVTVHGKALDNSRRHRYVPSIKKAQKELGLKLNLSLDESIQRMIEFNKRKK